MQPHELQHAAPEEEMIALAQPRDERFLHAAERPPFMYFTCRLASDTMVPMPMRWRRPSAASGTR
jgi:hypothetical protein